MPLLDSLKPPVSPATGRRRRTARHLIVGAAVATAITVAPFDAWRVTSLAAQAPARNFLWKVTAAEGPPSYLMGSLHVLTAGYYPLSAPIEAAFAASRILITEADIDQINDPSVLMRLLGKALLPENQTLDHVIAPALYKRVMAQAEGAGLPAAALQRMKPWMAAMALTAPALRAAGFKAEHGVDRHFYDRAKQAGYERRALETVDFQFDRMDQMSLADQEALLRSTVEDLDTQTNNVDRMAEAWVKGETGQIEQLTLTAMKTSPELYKRMLVDRNADWVPAVERCLVQKATCFVVVGAAHLVGEDSLVAMLRKKGYTVEQQ